MERIRFLLLFFVNNLKIREANCGLPCYDIGKRAGVPRRGRKGRLSCEYGADPL